MAAPSYGKRSLGRINKSLYKEMAMIRLFGMIAIALAVIAGNGSAVFARETVQHTTMIGNSRYGHQFNRGYQNGYTNSRGNRGYSYYGGGPYGYGYDNGAYYNGYGNGVYYNGVGNPGYFGPYYPNGPSYGYGGVGVFDNNSFYYR